MVCQTGDLVIGESLPLVGVDPLHRADDEGGQHVEHVVVGDVVHRVHLVDATDRRAPGRVLEAVLDGGVEQQDLLVVALLCLAGELSCAIKKIADRGDCVGAEQREAQRLNDAPRELLRAERPGDGNGIGVGVGPRDLLTMPVAVGASAEGSDDHGWNISSGSFH